MLWLTVPLGMSVRLDKFLADQAPEHSRSAWQAAIRQGAVTVNGRPGKPGQLLHGGEVIRAQPPEPAPAAALRPAEELPPTLIVFEDSDLVIVNKPRGMVVHPARGHHGDSLVERLVDRLDASARAESPVRPGVVHRLDRDTTGLLLLAKTAAARRYLAGAMQAGAVRREYVALVQGWPEPPEGVIEAPIGRDPGNRLRMAVVWQGRPARTRFRVMCRYVRPFPVAALWLALESGRTHQIRVHLASLGHPVLGDPLYGRGPQLGLPAQALHAFRLRFPHPGDGRRVEALAPVPPDWNTAWGALEPDAAADAAAFGGWWRQVRAGPAQVRGPEAEPWFSPPAGWD